jgi:hypothetical protein
MSLGLSEFNILSFVNEPINNDQYIWKIFRHPVWCRRAVKFTQAQCITVSRNKYRLVCKICETNFNNSIVFYKCVIYAPAIRFIVGPNINPVAFFGSETNCNQRCCVKGDCYIFSFYSKDHRLRCIPFGTNIGKGMLIIFVVP